MSLTRAPRFTTAVRLADTRVDDPDAIGLKPLRDAVAGKNTDWPRAHAMTRLLESDFPNKHHEFVRVVANEADVPEARHLAALHLGMIDTPAAVAALIALTAIRDEYVLTGVLKALGRVGNAEALAAIEHVLATHKGVVATQAAFAAALIAHRLNLPGHALPIPAPSEYEGTSDAQGNGGTGCACERLRVTVASVADAELCLRSLSRRPFAVELLESPMYEMRCGRHIWMLALNRDVRENGAVDRIATRKMLLAIVARHDPQTGLYGPAFVVLTTPDRAAGGAHILMHRVDGGLVSAGYARIVNDSGAFALRPVKGPRPYSVSAEGRLEPGRIVITGATAGRGEKRTVVRELFPGSSTPQGAIDPLTA